MKSKSDAVDNLVTVQYRYVCFLVYDAFLTDSCSLYPGLWNRGSIFIFCGSGCSCFSQCGSEPDADTDPQATAQDVLIYSLPGGRIPGCIQDGGKPEGVPPRRLRLLTRGTHRLDHTDLRNLKQFIFIIQINWYVSVLLKTNKIISIKCFCELRIEDINL